MVEYNTPPFFTKFYDDSSKINVYVGDDGKLHFVDRTGADSVLPFSGSGNYELDQLFFKEIVDVRTAQTISYTFEEDTTGYIIAMVGNANNNFKILNAPYISNGSIKEIFSDNINVDSPLGPCIYIGEITAKKDAIITCQLGAYDWGHSIIQILGTKNISSTGNNEIEILPLVPVLTSNISSDGGEASVSSTYGGSNAFALFDGNISTIWHSNAWTPQWVQYRFAKPTCVKQIELITSPNGGIKASLQASNDNSNWISLSQLIDFPLSNSKYNIDIDNNQYYIYYRLYVEESYYITANVPYVVISELQFYGYQMEALVPTMTSDTTPDGYIVSASSTTEGYNYHPYHVFDNDETTHWYAGELAALLNIEFPNPTKVKSFALTPFFISGANVNCVKDYQIQASNNNIDWGIIYTGVNTSNTANTIIGNIDVANAYKYYRIYIYSTHASNASPGITSLQFYAEPAVIAKENYYHDSITQNGDLPLDVNCGFKPRCVRVEHYWVNNNSCISTLLLCNNETIIDERTPAWGDTNGKSGITINNNGFSITGISGGQATITYTCL